MKVATLSKQDYSTIIYDHLLSFLVEINLRDFDEKHLISLLEATRGDSERENQVIRAAIELAKA